MNMEYLDTPPDLSDWLRPDNVPRPGLLHGSVLRSILLADDDSPAAQFIRPDGTIAVSLYLQVGFLIPPEEEGAEPTIGYRDDPHNTLNPVFLNSAGQLRPLQYRDGSLVMLTSAAGENSANSGGTGADSGPAQSAQVGQALAQSLGAAIDTSASVPKVEKWNCKPGQDYYVWRNLFENRLSRKKLLPVPISERSPTNQLNPDQETALYDELWSGMKCHANTPHARAVLAILTRFKRGKTSDYATKIWDAIKAEYESDNDSLIRQIKNDLKTICLSHFPHPIHKGVSRYS